MKLALARSAATATSAARPPWVSSGVTQAVVRCCAPASGSACAEVCASTAASCVPIACVTHSSTPLEAGAGGAPGDGWIAKVTGMRAIRATAIAKALSTCVAVSSTPCSAPPRSSGLIATHSSWPWSTHVPWTGFSE